MTILLDTHYLLWTLSENSRLKGNARKLIEDPKQEVRVSVISLWEIAVKSSLGKLTIEGDVQGVLDRLPILGFRLLGLEVGHILMLRDLPLHHRDPFDRMLIAQAQAEGMHILTADPHFAAYEVPLAV